MKPGDHIIYPTPDGVTYVWRVSGVYYAAVGHEDMVGIQSVTRNPGSAHGVDIDEMLVPFPLVQGHVFQRPEPTLRGTEGSSLRS